MEMASLCLLQLLALWSMAASSSNIDWTFMCNKCKCVWSGGKRTADCTNMGIGEIPSDLSKEIREIDFSSNPIYGLGLQVFTRAHLGDVHRLKLHNCSLQTIDKTAFQGLLNLIDLDLSKNLIEALHVETFRENLKMRVLTLSYNQIKRLEARLFSNLTHLQRVLLDNNEIDYIDDLAFSMLPVLQHIDLKYNKLTRILKDFTKDLPKVNSLNLEGNHWICDCHLQEFRNKTISENIITDNTACAEPSRLEGLKWRDPQVIFACLPEIIEPLPSTSIEATTANVTLTCRVRGEPQPDVDWVTNGRIIDKDPRQNTQRFVTIKRKVGDFTYNNLTITNVNYRDKGEYKCVAKNPGGVDEKNVSLIVSVVSGVGGGSSFGLGNNLPLVIGLSVSGLVILVVALVLLCCCCNKRSTHGMSSKRRDLIQNSSDECIRLHRGHQVELEKALITDVNPVMKPPRVCSVAPSGGGTEVSEVKKNLLDSDSVFGTGGDDESRSLDFEIQPYRQSQHPLDSEYHHCQGNNLYPPDLLSFPPRICQVSPAGSSASTVADTSRLPPHHALQSPMPLSPMYDTMSLYRTLPHSRSQSPFVGPRVPRQGYVTIPRRPPRQSWSSEPPADNPTMLSGISEPLYDNLGLRTTIDGSSALSLNKMGNSESGAPSAAKSFARIFPLSPCDPIAEHESGSAATLPRHLDGGASKLSPSRTQWAMANAEALRSPERRNSIPGGELRSGPKLKIAPVPPPKPKKRASTGPLFEDEGEDGTEV